MIRFTVEGQPVGKERPRLGRGRHVYTPEKTKRYEQAVGMAFLKANGGQKLSPAAMSVRAHCVFKNKRHADPDNCLKGILDGLCGLAFPNDNAVASSVSFAFDGTRPRTEVEVGA
jgi:Holliday junction resolvase RusA-like endonuclease